MEVESDSQALLADPLETSASPSASAFDDSPAAALESNSDTIEEDQSSPNRNAQTSSFPVKIDRNLPLACHFDPLKNMFRVTRSRGNTLSSGGYGVVFPKQLQQTNNKNNDCSDSESDNNQTNNSDTHLFIEEVLVLHKQGLLEAWDESQTYQYTLQQLLEKMVDLGICWPVFLVYAHLRQQTYRVVRHTVTRREILLRMQDNQQQQPRRTSSSRKELERLKQMLRLDTAQAAPPCNITSLSEGDSSSSLKIIPAFDVYQPNSNFAKTNPGLPAFSVAITVYSHCLFTFQQWLDIVAVSSPGKIKIAAVSDGGTVLVFGITQVGVPDIHNNKINNSDDPDEDTSVQEGEQLEEEEEEEENEGEVDVDDRI